MKTKNRPQYVIDMIDNVNTALRAYNVKDVSDNLFCFACNYLMEKKMYEGFNFYKIKTIDGKERKVLAGRSEKDKFDFLQIH